MSSIISIFYKNKISILIIIILCIILLSNYYFLTIKNNSFHKCIIPNKYYHEIINIVKNKNLIVKELENIIDNKQWSIWGSAYTNEELKKTPRFSEMSTLEKISHLDKNKKKIGNDNSWKLFGLILEKNPIVENIKICPETFNIIKDIPGLINAGFSCLEAKSLTPYHNDKDTRFYRVHVPLIIPDYNQIGLDVFDNTDKITLNWNTDYFIFDDTCFHQAYNKTNENRIVLLLDIERRV